MSDVVTKTVVIGSLFQYMHVDE